MPRLGIELAQQESKRAASGCDTGQLRGAVRAQLAGGAAVDRERGAESEGGAKWG